MADFSVLNAIAGRVNTIRNSDYNYQLQSLANAAAAKDARMAAVGTNAASGISAATNNAASQLAQQQAQYASQLSGQAAAIQASQQAQSSLLAQQAAAAQQAQQQAVTPTAAGTNVTSSPVTGGPTASSGTKQSFLNAIAKQESGGSYTVVNKSSGALGKYQVMPGNVASWTKAALGKSLTPAQYLASPAAQDAVAQHILGGYYDKYGAGGAAVAWYAGEGAAKKYVAGSLNGNKSQGSYPTINGYAKSVLSLMARGK